MCVRPGWRAACPHPLAAPPPSTACLRRLTPQGLYLVASSGGGAFVPRVRTGLTLAQELMVRGRGQGGGPGAGAGTTGPVEVAGPWTATK